MTSTTKKIIAVFGVAVLFLVGLRAAEPGSTALPFLKFDTNARAMAMAGAYGSIGGGVMSAHYNPAGVAFADFAQIGGMFRSGIMDTSVQYFTAGMPLSFSLSSVSHPVGSISFLSSNHGKIAWYKLSDDGVPIYQGLSRDAGMDYALAFTLGDTVAITNTRSGGYVNHYAGATIKLLSSQLPDSDGNDVSASAVAFDLGYIARFIDAGYNIGASVSNIGGKIKYVSEKDSLPMTVRLGGSYKPRRFLPAGSIVSADMIGYTGEKESNILIGTEVPVTSSAKVRAGYKFLADNGAFSAGFGTEFMNAELDFAMVFDSELENSYEVSAVYKFGRSKSSQEEGADRRYKDTLRYETRKKPSPIPIRTSTAPKAKPAPTRVSVPAYERPVAEKKKEDVTEMLFLY